jgi:hypothetical protein
MLTLKYKDKRLESEYQQYISQTRRNLNIKMILIILAYSVVNNLLYSLRPFHGSEFILYYNTITSYVSTGIYFLLLVLSLACTTQKTQRWISILSYYFLLFTDIVFQLYFLLSDKDILIFSLIFTLQHLFRLSWYYFGLITILENIFLTVAICSTILVYFGPFIPFEYHYGISINSFVLIVVGILAYFYIMEKKKSFYFNQSHLRKTCGTKIF